MPPTRRAAAAAIGLAVLAPRLLHAQEPPPPLVKPERLRQVSDHVHVIPDNSVPLVPNVGFVVGSRGLLVIDTGLGPRNGAAVAAVAQSLAALRGARELHLATTHVHPEHDLGAQAFPAETVLIRSADQVRDIDEFGLQLARTFAARFATNAELLQGAEFRRASIVFEHDYSLDLGGAQVRLVALGANHTRGDTAFWVEPDRVLFSGDVAMQAQPSFASPYSSLRHWLASLDRLEQLRPVQVVPSHGPSGGPEFIAGYREYLIAVRDRTEAVKRAGQGVDEAVAAVAAALAPRYPDRGRLAGAIRSAYAEAP